MKMDKILNFTDRLKDKEKRQRKETFRQTAEVVQRTVQCSSCGMSCAMCGVHLEKSGGCGCGSTSNLNLCEFCRAEFSDYLKMSKLETGSEQFWHNKEWMKLWSAWLEYHKAINAFRNSKEFRQLLKETE